MNSKLVSFTFMVLALLLGGCKEVLDGDWPPFEWGIESVAPEEDFFVRIFKEEHRSYVMIGCLANSGEVNLRVDNYSPWLSRHPDEPVGNESVGSKSLRKRIYKWGEIEIKGHDVKLKINDLSAYDYDDMICIPLTAGDSFSNIIIRK